jgi:hypothetical protein
MRESRTYGSVRGARDEIRVPTATTPSSSLCSVAARSYGRLQRGRTSRPCHGSGLSTIIDVPDKLLATADQVIE